MFSLHATPERKVTITDHCVWRKLPRENHVIIMTSSFSKSSVFKLFSVTRKRKVGVFKFSSLKSIFEKLRRLREGLAWRVDLDQRNKPAFSNFSSLKGVFEKLRFRDGLAWSVGIDQRNKAAFSDWFLRGIADAAQLRLLLNAWKRLYLTKACGRRGQCPMIWLLCPARNFWAK